MKREEVIDLLPIYVLDGVDEDERRDIEAWLLADPELRLLAESYRQVTDPLVLTVPLQPAREHLQAGLKRRLAERQTQTRPFKTRIALATRVVSQFAPLAAAFLIVAFLTLLTILPDSPGDAREGYSRLVSMEGAQPVPVLGQQGYEHVTGDVVTVPGGSHCYARIVGLPALPEGHVYQVWLMDETGIRPGASISASLVVEGEPVYVLLHDQHDEHEDVVQIAVSIESAPTSTQPERPTTPFVFTVWLRG